MHELDHHYENESRYSCDDCNDSGIHNETREYCACRLGLARCNSDAFSEMLRRSPFTDAMWAMHQSTVKTAKAIAAAELALLKSKLLQKERELAEVRALPQGWRERLVLEKNAQEQHYGEVAAAAAAGSRFYAGERDCTEGVILGVEYCINALDELAAQANKEPKE